MAHANPSDARILELLTRATRIAVVGASSNPAKPSREIVQRLVAHGYEVVPINPNETEVVGIKAYPSLTAAREALGQPFDIVDVFRRADDTPAVAEEAVATGAGALWLQSGIVSATAAQIAERAGLPVIMDLCISVELNLLTVPRKGASARAPTNG